ncbi:hypothetical protein JC525_19050 [Alteromonas sp. IB21]|jgi:hypothetical protein|nr:hypothetical protein [Alteromonas sp. IB21]MBJ2131022.1 hypothetical protein [Alteromonas sp. IB21]
MSKHRKEVSKETAKVVATMMVPMVALGLVCLSVGAYLMNNVFTGI